MNKQATAARFLQKRGMILGALIPVVTSPLTCLALYSYRRPRTPEGYVMKFWEFYEAILDHETQVLTFICLCALNNLPVFFYLIWKKKDWMARGMIYSTMGWAAIFFFMKLF